MQNILLKTVTLQNEIRDKVGYLYLGFCREIGQYVLSVMVAWTQVYERYYIIDEADYLNYQINREGFMQKYAKEIGQKRDCFSERFLGSAALRDYDGTEGFQNMISNEAQPFQGYLYHDGALYARIVTEDGDLYVPPVRYLPEGSTDAERRPLRQKCRLIMNPQGEPICFQLDE